MVARHPDYTVECVSWATARDALSSVRRAVFVVEQGVPEHLEWDEHDAHAVHALARSGDGAAIGTGRLSCDGRIGRMAVVAPWRGAGVGSVLLRTLLAEAHARRYPSVTLHAQTHALDFYAKHGFVARGDEFMEAGIPHREMVLTIPQR